MICARRILYTAPVLVTLFERIHVLEHKKYTTKQSSKQLQNYASSIHGSPWEIWSSGQHKLEYGFEPCGACQAKVGLRSKQKQNIAR